MRTSFRALYPHRCIAAAGSVTIMIPMDTIKVRYKLSLSTGSGCVYGILLCLV